ncbi:MAG: hypothetical protein ACLPSW_35960 [Roseiarcus sp.]
MGRWYQISIGQGANQISYTAPEGEGCRGLNVELDITVMANDIANSGAYFRVWGIPLQQLGPNYPLVGQPVSISAGMSMNGLPLAKPSQRGLLASGTVFQAFGNAEGLSRTLDVIFNPGSVPSTQAGANPKPQVRNIVLNWPKGQPLQQALRQTLQTAFPDVPIGTFNISSQIVAPQDQIGYHANIAELALYLRRVSQDIVKTANYPGVSIGINGGKFTIGDGTTPQQSNAKIAFEDLIGNVTWIGPNTIQFKTVMRADIKFLDVVTLPQNAVVSYGPNTVPEINQQTLFQGSFTVQKIRHVGNYRQPDADSWVSIFDAVAPVAVSSTNLPGFTSPEPSN